MMYRIIALQSLRLQKIERLTKNKVRYELLEEKLKESGQPQISTTDQDVRAL
jgi:hypothetical protein